MAIQDSSYVTAQRKKRRRFYWEDLLSPDQAPQDQPGLLGTIAEEDKPAAAPQQTTQQPAQPRPDVGYMRNTFEFEKGYGSAQGTGLPNYGYKTGVVPDLQTAEQRYIDEYYPKVKDFPTGGLQERMGDYVFNTGRDPRDLMLFATGLISLDQFNNEDFSAHQGIWEANKGKLSQVYNSPDFLKRLDAARETAYRTTGINPGTGKRYGSSGQPNDYNPAWDASWSKRMAMLNKTYPYEQHPGGRIPGKHYIGGELANGTFKDPDTGEQITYKDGDRVPSLPTGSIMQPGDEELIQPTKEQVFGSEPLNQPLSPDEAEGLMTQQPGGQAPVTQAQTGNPQKGNIVFDARTGTFVDQATGEPVPTTTDANGNIVPQPVQPAPAPGWNPETGVATRQGDYIKQGFWDPNKPVGQDWRPPMLTEDYQTPQSTPPAQSPTPQTDQYKPTAVPGIDVPEGKTEKDYTDEYFRTIREMFTMPEDQKDRRKGLSQAAAFLALGNLLTNAVNYKFATPGTPIIKTDNRYLFKALDEENKLRQEYHDETETYKKELQRAGLYAMGLAKQSAESDKDRTFRASLANAEMQFRSAETAAERNFRAQQAERLFGNQKEIAAIEAGNRNNLTDKQIQAQKDLEQLRHTMVLDEIGLRLQSAERQEVIKGIFEAQKDANKDGFSVIDMAGKQYTMPGAIYWDVARAVVQGFNEQAYDQFFAQDYNAQTNAIKLMVAQYWTKYYDVDRSGNWSRKGSQGPNYGGIDQILPPGMQPPTTGETDFWGD